MINNWQTMQTAPEDGSDILLYSYDESFMYIGSYDGRTKRFFPLKWSTGEPPRPILWQHLPDTPITLGDL